MAKTIPLASHEVRWFFDGTATQHESLKRWFETIAPIPQHPGVGPLVWQGRLDDQPDVYLLVPGSDDMGIKWREGELQMKGRASSLGTQVFCGRHQGVVERWIKWSYAHMPTAYHRLFTVEQESGLVTAQSSSQFPLHICGVKPTVSEGPSQEPLRSQAGGAVGTRARNLYDNRLFLFTLPLNHNLLPTERLVFALLE